MMAKTHVSDEHQRRSMRSGPAVTRNQLVHWSLAEHAEGWNGLGADQPQNMPVKTEG